MQTEREIEKSLYRDDVHIIIIIIIRNPQSSTLGQIIYIKFLY